MELRMIFDKDAENYDKFRPSYNDGLFEDVIRYSALSSGSKALEIGIGTGQATRPFLETGCHVTAIEIGENLVRLSKEKFSRYKNFEIINQDFESVCLPGSDFDLAYSATAFHWIPRQTGIPKILHSLKPGGAFAWFSLHPSPAENNMELFEAIQEVYIKYQEHFGKEKQLNDSSERKRQLDEKLRDRASVFQQYGFYDVINTVYKSERILGAEDYIKLLETYSDHRAMPQNLRKAFLANISRIINQFGGSITLSDTTLMCMGRKPK